MAISEKKERERESTKSILQGRVFILILEVIPSATTRKQNCWSWPLIRPGHCFYCWGEADLRKQWSTYLNLLNRAWSQNEVPLIKFYMVFLTDSFESNNEFFIFPDILQTSMFIKRRRIDLIIVRYAYNNHTLIIHV